MKKDLTYSEFSKMCTDAGIASNDAEMEQDFRNGVVMADLVDVLMDLLEAAPVKGTEADDIEALGHTLDALELTGSTADARRQALLIAARAVRYCADHCHDESGN